MEDKNELKSKSISVDKTKIELLQSIDLKLKRLNDNIAFFVWLTINQS